MSKLRKMLRSVLYEGAFLLGLTGGEEIEEPPVPLKPCKVCGGTDVHLTKVRILGCRRYLVWCIPCELGSDPEKDIRDACNVWNLNVPEKAILEKRIAEVE